MKKIVLNLLFVLFVVSAVTNSVCNKQDAAAPAADAAPAAEAAPAEAAPAEAAPAAPAEAGH